MRAPFPPNGTDSKVQNLEVDGGELGGVRVVWAAFRARLEFRRWQFAKRAAGFLRTESGRRAVLCRHDARCTWSVAAQARVSQSGSRPAYQLAEGHDRFETFRSCRTGVLRLVRTHPDGPTSQASIARIASPHRECCARYPKQELPEVGLAIQLTGTTMLRRGRGHENRRDQ